MCREEEKSTETVRVPDVTRRQFIKFTGAVLFVFGTGGCSLFSSEADPTPTTAPSPTAAATATSAPTQTPVPTAAATATPGTGQILVPGGELPAADGYLLVDVEKCQGCMSCMLACSLIHEGVESLSLSRIQIMQNPYGPFPDDLTIAQCRQCVDPACVEVCPVDALEPDPVYGNVRIVDKEKCIGCGLCFEACPYTPSRAFLAPDKAYSGEAKSRKCDLCAYAPYHWDAAGGGPDGKQACVAVCPVGAILFTKEIPVQEGDAGYKVNLRDAVWGSLGFPTS